MQQLSHGAGLGVTNRGLGKGNRTHTLKNKATPFTGKQMKPEIITMSELSHSLKDSSILCPLWCLDFRKPRKTTCVCIKVEVKVWGMKETNQSRKWKEKRMGEVGQEDTDRE